MESYYLKIWDLNGSIIESPIDSIRQTEEEARYLENFFPYILEINKACFSTGKSAILHHVTDQIDIQLPYVGGSRSTAVYNDDYYMIYYGAEGVHLTWFDGDAGQIHDYITNLPNESGSLLLTDSDIYFLSSGYQDIDRIYYSLYTSSCPEPGSTSLSFTKQTSFSTSHGNVVDELFSVDNNLCCIIGNDKGLCSLGRVGQSGVSVDCVLRAEVRLLKQDSRHILFYVADKPSGNHQIITCPHEGYQDFLMYFDQAQ